MGQRDKPRNIYKIWLNADTQNFGGLEWIVDGEIGRMNYPGTWAECTVRAYYRRGLSYDKPSPTLHTYTVTLEGKHYAVSMDLFATTVYGLGTDKGKAITNIHSIDERNDAIKKISMAYADWETAYRIAKSEGLYSGQLYEK